MTPPWEDADPRFSYLHEVDNESNNWEQCDFQSGAKLFTLQEANKVCAWLNKTNKNFFEIDIKQVYMNTRQSKLNDFKLINLPSEYNDIITKNFNDLI